MQGYSFIVKYLLLFVCFISLSAFTQTAVNDALVKTVNDSLTVQDTVKPKNSEQIDQIVSYAKKFLGTPYRYAGTTPSGFDCSGFISYVFGNFGFSLVHSSYGMAEFGATVKLADVQAGDLLFFKGSNVNSTRVGHEYDRRSNRLRTGPMPSRISCLSRSLSLLSNSLSLLHSHSRSSDACQEPHMRRMLPFISANRTAVHDFLLDMTEVRWAHMRTA